MMPRLRKAKKHIVVGTPCYGGNVTAQYALSMIQLTAACVDQNIGLSVRLLSGDALVSRARNTIVRQFLDDPTATHLLFIDADIGFDPPQVFTLLKANRDVVGAIYPIKSLDWDRIRASAIAAADSLPASGMSYVVDCDDSANLITSNRFARVRYLGTGFMMIKRGVFALMAQHYPEIRYEKQNAMHDLVPDGQSLHAFFDCQIDHETSTYLSEDFTFCRRWTEIGGEIWADLRSNLTHVGSFEYRGDLMTTLSLKRKK